MVTNSMVDFSARCRVWLTNFSAVKNSQTSAEPEAALPCTPAKASGPCYESDESTPGRSNSTLSFLLCPHSFRQSPTFPTNTLWCEVFWAVTSCLLQATYNTTHIKIPKNTIHKTSYAFLMSLMHDIYFAHPIPNQLLSYAAVFEKLDMFVKIRGTNAPWVLLSTIRTNSTPREHQTRCSFVPTDGKSCYHLQRLCTFQYLVFADRAIISLIMRMLMYYTWTTPVREVTCTPFPPRPCLQNVK